MISGGAFEPAATHAMGIAFDEICSSLRVPLNAAEDRHMIAARILELARSGELDPVILFGRVIHEARLRDTIRRLAARDKPTRKDP